MSQTKKIIEQGNTSKGVITAKKMEKIFTMRKVHKSDEETVEDYFSLICYETFAQFQAGDE